MGSYDKTSYRILKWGPGYHYSNILVAARLTCPKQDLRKSHKWSLTFSFIHQFIKDVKWLYDNDTRYMISCQSCYQRTFMAVLSDTFFTPETVGWKRVYHWFSARAFCEEVAQSYHQQDPATAGDSPTWNRITATQKISTQSHLIIHQQKYCATTSTTVSNTGVSPNLCKQHMVEWNAFLCINYKYTALHSSGMAMCCIG